MFPLPVPLHVLSVLYLLTALMYVVLHSFTLVCYSSFSCFSVSICLSFAFDALLSLSVVEFLCCSLGCQ